MPKAARQNANSSAKMWGRASLPVQPAVFVTRRCTVGLHAQDPTLAAISQQVVKLPASMISGLRGGLASVALQLRGVVSVATGCSGGEVLFHILSRLLALW